ncbi:MAG: ABC transporter ATP-binding protein [Candidatus Binatia bacterium]
MTAGGFELRAVGFQRRGLVVLEALTLRFPPRTRTAIVGPSGAGKSTLLYLLAGLEAPTDGEVLLDGAIVSRRREVVVPPHRRTVSMVFQDLALWPNLSALDNVVLGLAATGLAAPARRERARAVLELVGIGRLANRLPDTLSGGEQQRVALARALGPAPAYLLLDEPFASIDLPVKTRLLAEIARVAEEEQITVLLVTHDPLEALALCDEGVVIEKGRVVEGGAWQTLLDVGVPRSETLRAFQSQLAALRRLG